MCHLDRRQTEGQPQWRDLRYPTTNPPRIPTADEEMCHLDRRQTEGQPQWRDLRYPTTNLPRIPTPELPGPPTSDEEMCHLDRRQTEGQPQRRDLRYPTTNLPRTQLARLQHQAARLRANAVDYLQIREKDLAPADLLILATTLRQTLPPGTRPRLLLNLGHQTLPPEALLDLALSARFDGLHLPAGWPADSKPTLPASLRAAFAHAGLPPPILSASAHTFAEVEAARAAGLDLILFGPVFGKTVFDKVAFDNPAPGQLVAPAAGLDALRAAVQVAGPIPVLTLGGITAENTAACLAAGAQGIAGIRLFL